jgi:hypothetical protein
MDNERTFDIGDLLTIIDADEKYMNNIHLAKTGKDR